MPNVEVTLEFNSRVNNVSLCVCVFLRIESRASWMLGCATEICPLQQIIFETMYISEGELTTAV